MFCRNVLIIKTVKATITSLRVKNLKTWGQDGDSSLEPQALLAGDLGHTHAWPQNQTKMKQESPDRSQWSEFLHLRLCNICCVYVVALFVLVFMGDGLEMKNCAFLKKNQ